MTPNINAAAPSVQHRLFRKTAMILATLGMTLALTGFSMNAHSSSHDDDLSPKEVRELLQAGEIQPLLTLIAQHNFDGNLLDAELEREDGRLIYELEFLNEQGEVWEYEVDAASGEILQQERDD